MSNKRFKGLRNRSHRNESLKEQVRSYYQEPSIGQMEPEHNEVVSAAAPLEPSFEPTDLREDIQAQSSEGSLNSDLGLNPLSSTQRDDREESVMEDNASSEEKRSFASSVSDDLPKITDDPDFVPIKPSLSEDEVPNMPGAILKHAREMLGMSQREVANCLKLRVNTVSDIEHDRLNQPTAVPFATTHITAYANLVNVDAATLLKLYRRNVEEAVELSSRGAMPHDEGGHGWLVFSIIALLAVGVVTWWALSGSPSKEGNSGALLVNQPANTQPQNNGSLVLEKSETGPENISVKPETPTVNVQTENQVHSASVDENTLRARRQAVELGTNEIENEDPQQSNVVSERQPTNKTENATVLTTSVPAANSRKEDRTAVTNSSSANTAESSAQAAQPQSTVATPKQDAAESETKKSDDKTAETEKNQVEQPKALSANLKDVTGSVKIVNRDGLASLNTVVIKVNGPVALKVTDSRGKVLAGGSFKSGDKVTATGIPPLKVSVSDSALVTVNYMGGRVSVPSMKQITYTLPTR